MNKLALYVFPLGVLAFGAFLPIAILLYWVSNNAWTYGQQHLVFGKIDKEEAAKKAVVLEKRTENAPKPGVKPVAKPKPGARPKLSKTTSVDAADTSSNTDKPTAPKPKPRQPATRSKSKRKNR
jgi:YidC/Oxa1 family membrane protein insertase